MTNKFTLFESIDEMQSRLKSIKLECEHLSNYARVIQKKSKKKGFLLPFDTSYLDQKIKEFIQVLEWRIGELEYVFPFQEELGINKIAHVMYDLRVDLDKLSVEHVLFQNLVEQRLKGIEFENPSYFPSSASTISGLQKIYFAVDALLYELFREILGKEWMSKTGFFPSSYFGGDNYFISTIDYICRIPIYDAYRSRYWPILAHEVAHAKLHQLSGEYRELLIELYPDEEGDIGDLIDYDLILKYPLPSTSEFENFKQIKLRKEIFQEVINKMFKIGVGTAVVPGASVRIQTKHFLYSQVTELMADLIGVYVAGPSILLAYSTGMMPSFYEYPNNVNVMRTHTHPPTDSRIYIMQRLMEKINGIKDFNYIEENVEEKIEENSVDDEVTEFITYYNGLIPSFSKGVGAKINEFFKLVSPNSKFSKQDWEKLNDYQTQNVGYMDELTPIELINLGWKKREKSFPDVSHDSDIKLFINRRYSEPKLFKIIIEKMYQYLTKVQIELERGD